MKIYELKDHHDRTFAFEVPIPFGGRRRVASILKAVPGATLTKAPRFLSWFREEVFCQFEMSGVRFEAREPFGDNARY